MSSQKDKKSNFWNNNINTEPSKTSDEEDTISHLLINSDFDAFDMPDITTHLDLFSSDGQWVDINTSDDFHDTALFMDTLVANTHKDIHNPVDLSHHVTEVSSAPIVAENTVLIPKTTTDPHNISMLAKNDTKNPLVNSAIISPPSQTASITNDDMGKAMPSARANITEAFTEPHGYDKYDKSIGFAQETTPGINPLEHQNHLIVPATAHSNTLDINVNKSGDDLPTSNNEPIISLDGNDKYDKTVSIIPFDTKESNDLVEITTSLVENNTKAEKLSNVNDIIPAKSISENAPSQTKSILPQNQRIETGNPIQTSVTITPTINATIPDTDWAVFKSEQEKIQLLLTNRIKLLEKKMTTALLFSLTAAILAGISIMAAVSGLIKP